MQKRYSLRAMVLVGLFISFGNSSAMEDSQADVVLGKGKGPALTEQVASEGQAGAVQGQGVINWTDHKCVAVACVAFFCNEAYGAHPMALKIIGGCGACGLLYYGYKKFARNHKEDDRYWQE